MNMRALVLRDFGKICVEERPRPTPLDGDVLVRMIATGICGSDVHGYTGENGRRQPGQIMGHETVGVVAELGGKVEDRSLLGALVTVNPQLPAGPDGAVRVLGVNPEISSAFAEYFTVPVESVVPLPPTMRVEHGALVEPLAVGFHAARRGAVQPDDRVLVLGAGPIGIACVLGARRLGASEITVTEPIESRRVQAQRLGVDVLNPSTTDIEEFSKRHGAFDVAIDAVGNSATISTALSAVRESGAVVLVGMAAPELQLSAYRVSVAERTLVGSFCYTREEFRETAQWAATEPDLLEGLIDARITFDEADAAFAALASNESPFSKVLVYGGESVTSDLFDHRAIRAETT